jgi:hypothetical protein
LFSICDKVKEL